MTTGGPAGPVAVQAFSPQTTQRSFTILCLLGVLLLLLRLLRPHVLPNTNQRRNTCLCHIRLCTTQRPRRIRPAQGRNHKSNNRRRTMLRSPSILISRTRWQTLPLVAWGLEPGPQLADRSFVPYSNLTVRVAS